MTSASPPAHERFEDRLLDVFLDRFEDIRGDGIPPEATLPAPARRHRGKIALTSLALVAAGLGGALAAHLATGSARATPKLAWALAGYVGSSWEGTAGRGLSVSGPYHQALTCPSATTCYVEGPAHVGPGAEVEATYNGGMTWQLGGVRGATALSNVSCPSARACAVLERSRDNQPLFVETTDGGRTWVARPAPNWLSPRARNATSGRVEVLTSLSCPNTYSCSVLAWSGRVPGYKPRGRSVASLTTDGGRTWSSPSPAFRASWELQCFAARSCLAAGPSGAAYSTDGGLRWSLSPGWPTDAAAYFSCATAAMCTALSLPPGGGAQSLLVSGDGGRSWSALGARGLPTGVLFTSLACPTRSQCWLSGNSNQGQFSGKGGVLLSSENGGRTWGTSLLPQGIGVVFAVSCPDRDVCFASAAKRPPASSPAASPTLVLLVHLAEGSHDAAP